VIGFWGQLVLEKTVLTALCGTDGYVRVCESLPDSCGACSGISPRPPLEATQSRRLQVAMGLAVNFGPGHVSWKLGKPTGFIMREALTGDSGVPFSRRPTIRFLSAADHDLPRSARMSDCDK